MKLKIFSNSKYKAKPKWIDGIRFASTKEAARYQELRTLAKTGSIKNLTLQPRFIVEVNGERICTYKADFQYYDNEKSGVVVEDVKGFKTPTYRLKKKLVEAIHKIKIFET